MDWIILNWLHRYEAVHAVKRFLRLTQEPVIMDFHRFAINSNLPKLFLDFLLALMGTTRQSVTRTWFGTFRSTKCEIEFPKVSITYQKCVLLWSGTTDCEFTLTLNPIHRVLLYILV